MARSPIFLVVSLAVAAAPAPARAQGAGLYEPFPEPVAVERAQRYLQQIGVRASVRDLRDGRLLGTPAAPGPARRRSGPAAPRPGADRQGGPATARAGIGSDQAPWPLLALLGSLLAVGAATVLRPPPAGASARS